MRNLTVLRIWGIPIRINISLVVFLPILAWLLGSGEQIGLYAGWIEAAFGVAVDTEALGTGSTPWVVGTLAAVGLFVSVTLHELGHAWVARRYGLGIESITLWILGGLAALSEIPREWNREFWIAIAGPVTSVATAGAAAGVLLVTPSSVPVAQFVFGWLAVANLTLAVFNLLPAFPMDGGRILRALLARNRPYASATRLAARVGIVFALLFALLGALSFNIIMLLLALFIYGAATTESRTVLLDELLEGITVGDIMSREPTTVPEYETVAEFADRMFRERRTVYPVTDEYGEVVGVVTLADMRAVAADERGSTTVGQLAKDVPRFDITGDAFETLAALNGSRAKNALVTRNGSVVGVLSESDYAHALSMQREFGSGLP
ncbi:site-2 protease family protein [Haloarchaeobius baliensis]|uniref:site-2 protease family protein n=1 Tax=Haloarchaeobius baliensis TaxID=1670458 RepID=UPI003F880E02